MIFTLLHLSDLHFDSDETGEVKQARRIVALSGLIRRLTEFLEEEPELRPQVICISGDLAYRGARVEYDAAEVWIRQLLDATGLTASDLILAAGNHDIDRDIAKEVDRPADHGEADQMLSVPANAKLTSAFREFEAFCERLGLPRLQLGSQTSYLAGSRTIGSVRFVVLNSAWLARDSEDATRLWLGYPQLLVLEARDQMCPFDRDFSTVEIAVFHHPLEYLAEQERNAFGSRPATFRHVAARVDLILTGHTHVQDVREPDQIGMRAYHFSGGATFVSNEYHNHVRLFRIDLAGRTVQVIAFRYDPLTQRWLIAAERLTYLLITRKQVERLQMSVREAPTVEDKGEPVAATNPEAHWHLVVDQARDLLRSGKSAAARSLLLDIQKKSEASQFSPKLQFRIATNLGGAAIELHDFKTAVTEMETAMMLERTAESVSNAALAQLGAGDIETALQLAKDALTIDHDSETATFVHLKALAAAGQHTAIDETVSALDPSQTKFAVALALADIFRAQKDHSNGESWARLAVQMNPEHAFANMLLAENIVADINKTTDREPSKLNDVVKRRLDDAETAVARALTVFGSDDHSSRVNTALNVRAGIAALRGAFEECLRYTEQVLSRDPDNDVAKQNRGLALYQLNRHDEAIAVLTSIHEPAIQEMVALALADAYLQADRPQEASQTLQPHFHPERADIQQLQAAEVLLESASRRKATADVNDLAKIVAEYWPNNPTAVAVVTMREFAIGDHENAIRRTEDALKMATGDVRASLLLLLARMYHDVKKYERSIELFEEGASPVTAATPSVDRYIHALYEVGRLDRALTLACEFRSTRKAAGKITEIEADILTQQGDVSTAAQLFENLSRAEPATVAHRTRLASLYARAGRREEAQMLVERIDLETISDEPARLFEVAKLRLVLEMPDVIRFAYFGRRADFYNAEAHKEFFRLFNAHDARDQASLAADVVAAGTTAYLVGSDGERIVSLFPESEPLRSPNELHPSSPLAVRLLGRRAGETVVIKQTAIEERIVTIREVISNYVWALRETVENFTTWFPDDPSVQSGGGDPASLERLARHLQTSNEGFAQLVEAYAKRKISLPLFAANAGMRSADAWRRLWNDSDMPIRVRTTASSSRLKETDTIVLEMTALLTLTLLGVLNSVADRFRVVVAQLTLDELNEEILQINIEELSAMKMANAEGDDEKLAALREAGNRRKLLIDLRMFVEGKTERRISDSFLKIRPNDISNHERLLGLSGLHSILVAADHHLAVIVDDSAVREIALTGFGVSAASSWDLLQELHRVGELTDADIARAKETLHSARYDAVTG